MHNNRSTIKLFFPSKTTTTATFIKNTVWYYITPAADLSFGFSLQREAALFHKEEIHSNSMQNRLQSWPPLVNQIKINTEAFNSISRQPEVVFKTHVVCSAGTTPVFWRPNSISSLAKERFHFTWGKQLQLEVSCQDRLPIVRREKSQNAGTDSQSLTCILKADTHIHRCNVDSVTTGNSAPSCTHTTLSSQHLMTSTETALFNTS